MKKSALLFTSALSLISSSVLADYSSAQRHLEKGEHKLAVTELNKLAKSGHVKAQFQLAQAYQAGQGVEADINKAYAWYLIAKDFGHPEAQSKYKELRRMVPSRKEAKNHYRALSDEYGYKVHQASFAPVTKHTNFYPQRAKLLEGVESNEVKLKEKFNVWATVAYNVNESGHVEDARILASFPKGVIDDKALETINQWQFEQNISPTGDARRTFDLMHTFKFKSDNNKANREFKRQMSQYTEKLKALADKGNGYAQHRYALMLEQKVIEAQENEHIDWYYKAAVNGNHEAQLRLMHCFANGEGCQPDENKAFNWLKKAAESENERAQYQLAMTMLNYESVHYDVAKASEILKAATLKQYLPAMVAYSHLLAFSDEASIRDMQAAVKFAELARALDNTNPVLLSVLGTAYSELGKIQQGNALLQQALNEANKRNWPAQNYINLIEQPQASMMADTH